MSMLNRRTQPLDPAALLALTGGSPPPAPSAPARPTSPLKEPGSLVDALAPASTKRTELPAQSASIMTALACPPAAAADTSTRLSEDEADLLLDVSSKLADIRDQDPAKFALVMSALQQLSTDASGSVDFSTLNAQQQQALTGLGMNPQNTKVIFHQLYQMLLPGTQQESSAAFKKIQAQVTGFISNLDLREKTVSQIQQQARDLAEVQGVVCNLSANSIHDLLADQTASVYDLSVSKINSQNFNIRNGMDYTLGHMVVLSQQSPSTLQQVEGLIQKIKTDQNLDAGEQGLLKQYGLNLNQQNKLETIDGKVLDYQAVNQLENVIFSMKDPSEGYQKVLQASAQVITQSHKLEQASALAKQQSAVVQQTTAVVLAGTKKVERLRQDANHIDAQLQFANLKASNLAKAMDAATNLFQTANIDPQMLSQWNIQIVPGSGQGVGGMKFMVEGKEVSRLEMLQRLGQLLTQQRAEVAGMITQLAQKKTETLTASAQLGSSTKTLETQKADLKATEQVIAQGTTELHRLEEEQKKLVAAELPNLKPEERKLVETVIAPMVANEVKVAVKSADEAIQEIHFTIAKADTALVQARAVQQAVAEDAKTWDNDIKQGQDLAKLLGDKIGEGKKAESGDAPTRADVKIDESSDTPLAPQPQGPAFESFGPDADTKAKERLQEQARTQKRTEDTFLENTRNEKNAIASRRHQQQVNERAQKDDELHKADLDKLKK